MTSTGNFRVVMMMLPPGLGPYNEKLVRGHG
jgi:hypothetical protein